MRRWTGLSLFFFSFNLSTAFYSPSLPTPHAPPSSRRKLTLVQPPLTPARAGTFPAPTPLRAVRPPTVGGSLPYGAPRLEKRRARARASTLRGHKGAKAGERRRPCWRAPARKLTRREPSCKEADRIKKTQGGSEMESVPGHLF